MAQQKNTLYDFFAPGKGNCKITNDDEGDEYYGMKHTAKASNVTRLWFTNPCGIGVDPMHPKSDTSFTFLKRNSRCDIFGLAETNVHWQLLYNHASLYSRIKNKWKSFKISTSHNSHEKIGKTQRGGTCTVAVNQIAHREYARGQDITGLGRWSWIELCGKEGYKTRVYTAYRPGGKPHRKKTAHTTVYEQHKRYIRGTATPDVEPRDLFDDDLCKEMNEIIGTTNIILMIDVNQNVLTGSFTNKMKDIGLTSVFQRLSYAQMPPTHHRGSIPISTIYVSVNLQPTRAGILPKTIGVQGDHRNIYVDITNESMIGTYMYKIVSQPMKRLQLKDSRTVKKFQDAVRKHLEANNMLQKGLQLMSDVSYPASLDDVNNIESYDEQLGRAIQHGKKKCRKLKLGEIPFSKTFEKLRDTRRLWLLVSKKKVGQRISNTTVRRLAKKLKIINPMSYPLQEIKKYLYNAGKEYGL